MKSESHSVMSSSLQPRGLYSPWNSPGQNTGVGSCSLLQGLFPTKGSDPGLLDRRQILLVGGIEPLNWWPVWDLYLPIPVGRDECKVIVSWGLYGMDPFVKQRFLAQTSKTVTIHCQQKVILGNTYPFFFFNVFLFHQIGSGAQVILRYFKRHCTHFRSQGGRLVHSHWRGKQYSSWSVSKKCKFVS